jgi:PIN domain nuclease of toxin-antitoxin system
MAAVVVDTHAAVWYLLNAQSLSSNAQKAMDEAVQAGDPVYVSSISLVEVVYLVEKGKLPAVVLDRLTHALSEPDSGFVIAPVNLAVALAILQISRETVPDMPDRIIAATAFHLSLPLVTRDSKIAKTGITTIW